MRRKNNLSILENKSTLELPIPLLRKAVLRYTETKTLHMPYLQKAWADSIENPTTNDIQTALSEVQRMDNEHGAFWVSTDEEEIVLEVQKDMRMTLILCGEICRESKCASWDQAAELYQLLITGEYEKVKDKFDCL